MNNFELSLRDKEEIYNNLKEIYKESGCALQEKIINEMKVLCKDILQSGWEISI